MSVACQISEKVKPAVPIKLEALTPQMDYLQGRVEDSYRPEIISIPKSGSARVYEVGLKLFEDGDYRRAMNAFELALLRARKYGAKDPRFRSAKAAIDSTKARLSLRNELGYDTDNKQRTALTGKVTRVFKPSLAWLGGLREDDQIVSARIEQNYIFLEVRRSGRPLKLKLKLKLRTGSKFDTADSARLQAELPSLAARISKPQLLEGSVKMLANYDCAILLDCSASMASQLETVPESTRWDWCKKEALRFASASRTYFPHGIMMLPFTDNFAVEKNAGPAAVASIYKTIGPSGGTDIAGPLSYVLDDYFQRRSRGRVKPLAIAILSDGESSPTALRDVIVAATLKLKHPKEVVITFLSLDDSIAGSEVIAAMDEGLVDVGAVYDIVDSRNFEELSTYGLLKAVTAALIEKQVEGR